MSNLCLIAASLVTQGQAPGWQLALPSSVASDNTSAARSAATERLCRFHPSQAMTHTAATLALHRPEFSQQGQLVALARPVRTTRPTSGSQLYRQRLAALKAGKIYTRLAANSFQEEWVGATAQPTYEAWVELLSQEAKAMGKGQGANRLTVLLGDSLAMWFPPERLSSDRFWLNQGISGDTTAGVLRRLSLLQGTRPTTIHVMAGINDLRRGATDAEVLANLQRVMQQLRQEYPKAQVFVYSILPTRLEAIPSSRIRWLNQNIAAAARQAGVSYLDLQPAFSDNQGKLRRALTTDGLHLSTLGYQMWQLAIASIF